MRNYYWILFGTGLVLCMLAVSGHAAVTIDFETPNLGASSRQVIDPYVDPGTGTTFTALPELGFNGIVGLVKNSSTSACVDPSSSNQLLGTTQAGDTSIGLAGFPIRATFADIIPAPASITVDVQTGAGSAVRVIAYRPNGAQVALNTVVAGPPNGTCGFPGSARARVTVDVNTAGFIGSVVVNVLAPVVFVIDDMVLNSAPVATEAPSWGAVKSLFQDKSIQGNM